MKRVIRIRSSTIPGWVWALVVASPSVALAGYEVWRRTRFGESVQWDIVGFLIVTAAVLGRWIIRRSGFGRFEVDAQELRFVRPSLFGTSSLAVGRAGLVSLAFRFVENFGSREALEIVTVSHGGDERVLSHTSYYPLLHDLPAVASELSDALGVPTRLVVRDTGTGEVDRPWNAPPPTPIGRKLVALSSAALPWVGGFLISSLFPNPGTVAACGAAILAGLDVLLYRTLKADAAAHAEPFPAASFWSWVILSPLYYTVAAVLARHAFTR
ncbi:MAG TPA: hypothetical protein VLA96_10105 [Terriglobales bacterium]|nr:hypothetical protein [Terriglobales bacterium]